MERSSKHGPAMDDALAKEARAVEQGPPVEPHVEQFKEQHGAGDDQPVPDARLTGGRSAQGDEHLDRDEVEARSELAKSVDPSVFPADKTALVTSARGNAAPAQVLRALEGLPDGREFTNVEEIWETLGGASEERF